MNTNNLLTILLLALSVSACTPEESDILDETEISDEILDQDDNDENTDNSDEGENNSDEGENNIGDSTGDDNSSDEGDNADNDDNSGEAGNGAEGDSSDEDDNDDNSGEAGNGEESDSGDQEDNPADNIEYVTLPSLIEAEDFLTQNGVTVEDNNNASAGKNIGYIHHGDSTTYPINVASSGTYYASIKASSQINGGSITFTINNQTLTTTDIAVTGSWNSWKEHIVELDLTAGEQTLVMTFTGSDGYLFNLDYINISDTEPEVTLVGPDESWTLCSLENELCEFSGGYHVAYGQEYNWQYSVEVDGIQCDSSIFQEIEASSDNSCWIKPATDYVVVRSIEEFRAAIANSNQKVRMKRGYYVVQDLLDQSETIVDPFVQVFQFDGNDNLLDMTGVTIDTPVALLSSMPSTPIHSHSAYKVYGNNITLLNGTFINTYPNGQHDVTDFELHNNSRDYMPSRQMTEFKLAGDGIQMLGNTIIVRGSYPYGYGDMFGKGSGSAVFLRKHAGVNVIGDNILIDGMNLTVLAFGHGIFMQGAQNTVIKNTIVQGRMRLGADMLEDGPDSIPAAFNYEQQSPDWFLGEPIEADKMYNLTEDGIRAYTQGTKLDGTIVRTGAITVENTKVINMRGCITTPLASEPSIITNVEVRGCSAGYALANDSVVSNSRGDAAYGPLYHSTYDTRRGAEIEITLTNNPSTGDHPIAYVAGSGHNITINADDSVPDLLREIRVGDTGARWADDPTYQDASDISIINKSVHPVILKSTSSNITVTSEGPVTNNGEGNTVN